MSARLVAALAATSLCVSCATAQPPPATEADPFDLLAGQLAARVGDEPINVSVESFHYAQSEAATPVSSVIRNDLAMALERSGKFRVVALDRIAKVKELENLRKGKLVASDPADEGAWVADVAAVISGSYVPQPGGTKVMAELLWKKGGYLNRAEVVVESTRLGADVGAEPYNLEQSQENLADVKQRVRSVPHDFDIDLLVSEGRRNFREGDVISYKACSEKACHVAVFCHQVDGSTVVLFPNQFSQDTWIPAGKTIDIPGTSKPGFEVIIGPPFGSDVVQIIACTSANELHARIAEINRASQGAYASVPRAQFSEYLTRGMSVAGTPTGGPTDSGPPKWATDYVVVSSRPR